MVGFSDIFWWQDGEETGNCGCGSLDLKWPSVRLRGSLHFLHGGPTRFACNISGTVFPFEPEAHRRGPLSWPTRFHIGKRVPNWDDEIEIRKRHWHRRPIQIREEMAMLEMGRDFEGEGGLGTARREEGQCYSLVVIL